MRAGFVNRESEPRQPRDPRAYRYSPLSVDQRTNKLQARGMEPACHRARSPRRRLGQSDPVEVVGQTESFGPVPEVRQVEDVS